MIKIPPVSPQSENVFQQTWFLEQVRRAIQELQDSPAISDLSESIDDRVASLLVAGSNITLTYNDIANSLTIAASGGGGSANSGTATLDFGSTPGTNITTTTITGQASILVGSKIKAYLMADTTLTHNSYEHSIVPLTITCGNIIAGTGFDIIASSDLRLTGTFTVQWEWV